MEFIHFLQHLGLPYAWAWAIGQVILIVVFAVVLLVMLAFILLFDRKVWAAVQMRRGPNVVGAFGLLQSFADFFKFMFKEPVIPAGANKGIFLLAPMLSFTLAFAAWAVVPLDNGWVFSDINVGVLYIFAISSLGVYGVIMGGWASNSKYPFLAALRSAAQMVWSEVSIGFVIITVLLFAGSLNLSAIVRAQEHGWYASSPSCCRCSMIFLSVVAGGNAACALGSSGSGIRTRRRFYGGILVHAVPALHARRICEHRVVVRLDVGHVPWRLAAALVGVAAHGGARHLLAAAQGRLSVLPDRDGEGFRAALPLRSTDASGLESVPADVGWFWR